MGKTELKIEIDAELLEAAKQAGVRLESAIEDGLRRAMREEAAEQRARQWAEDNAEAIREHDQRIAERGLIGAEWRRW
jgi:antitoxin CcdA